MVLPLPSDLGYTSSWQPDPYKYTHFIAEPAAKEIHQCKKNSRFAGEIGSRKLRFLSLKIFVLFYYAHGSFLQSFFISIQKI